MSATPRSIYTKLTPTKRGLFGYTQLWLAPDHLLLLTSSQFAEDYKRFAVADIQSIVVTELRSRVVAQAMMILAALAWMGLWFAVSIPFAKWAFLITGALALLWLMVDIARGPRCRCVLHTRVSRERLAPVSRMTTARKVLGTVRPMIEAVQGVLPEQISPVEIPSAALEPPPPEIVSSPGYVPEILFGVFLLNAVLIWAAMRFPKSQELSGALINTLAAEFLLIVVALVRRKGRDTRVIIYIVISLSLILSASDWVAIARELGAWYLTVLEKARAGNKSPSPISIFPPGSREALRAYIWRAGAGLIGLAAAFYERRKR